MTAIATRTAETTCEGPLASGFGASELGQVSRLFAGTTITVKATLEPNP